MKSSVTVTVLQPFDLHGTTYHAGQSINLSPIEAIVLSRKRRVTLTKRKAKPVPEPVAPTPVVPEPAPEPLVEMPRARRSYRRRDVQPDEMTVMEPQETTAMEPED